MKNQSDRLQREGSGKLSVRHVYLQILMRLQMPRDRCDFVRFLLNLFYVKLQLYHLWTLQLRRGEKTELYYKPELGELQ